ncbi:MAG: molybdopterin molybdotransferase MoeA [Andreesenia angusta]|nr:molybdopterin molybdotransferase MoeA [Andreesenia angusta]
MIENIEVELARKTLIDRVQLIGSETISLEESLGRILSKDFESTLNVPDFRKSALDGFALNYKDTEDIDGVEKAFKINNYIEAGNLDNSQYTKDSAIKIMTGAQVPEGYNTVIKKEIVREDDGYVYIADSLKENANVVSIGEDIKSGDRIASRGEKINPGIIGVLASLGVENIEVVKRPRIGILNTGKEIVSLGEKKSIGQIFNSNYYTLASILRKIGCEPINLGIATDDIDEISKIIDINIDNVDMIITTGGASVGDYDFIFDVYKNLKADILFKRVDMKPGTPMLSAYYKDKLLIGLSGNPGAAFVSFDYIAIPAIKKLIGYRDIEIKRLKAVLKNDFNKKSKRRRLVRALFEIGDEKNYVSIMKDQKSGTLQSMMVCNCLIDIKAPNSGLKKGEEVEIILLEGGDLL